MVRPVASRRDTICSARSSGSEGCFGVALDVTVKLTRTPDGRAHAAGGFPQLVNAARATSAIIAAGIVPAALEMMDGPTIRAVEASVYAAGYPTDVNAVLLAEVDGLAAGLDADARTIAEICTDHGARTVRVASDPPIAPDCGRVARRRSAQWVEFLHLVVQDAVIPRTRLPDVLIRIREIAAEHGVTVCNVFHAGDGNLHPNIPYQGRRSRRGGARRCGHARDHAVLHRRPEERLPGEHGVGLDKLEYMS